MKARDIHPAMLARPRQESTERRDCDPTQDEIARMMKIIKSEWSERTRRQRTTDKRDLGRVIVRVIKCQPSSIDYE